MYKLPP